MKTQDQIKAEFDKVTKQEDLGGLKSILAAAAAQALSWVLNDDAEAASDLINQAQDGPF